MKILLLEDDQCRSRFIRRGPTEEGHTVLVREDSNDAEDQIFFEPFGAVILDLSLACTVSLVSRLTNALCKLVAEKPH